MTKITQEIEDLFWKVKVSLGAPIRSVELENDQLCGLLDLCIEDYAERAQNFVIDNN